MENHILEAIVGLCCGFAAGVTGYAVSLSISAIFVAFGAFIPVLIVLGLLYSIISFVLGIRDAMLAGAFFSFGIIGAGGVVGDFIIMIGGLISFVGLILSLISKHKY